MISSIREASKANAKGVLYAGLLGLLVSDILPTPADALYFYLERDLRNKWKKGEITPKQYWTREAIYYYSLNPIWWALVIAVAVNMKGDAKQKLNTVAWIIGGGAVVGVLYKNIAKDKLDLEKELVEKTQLQKNIDDMK